MSDGIQWGLLGPPVDIAGAVQAGFQTGRAMKMQRVRERAMAELAANPQDVRAQSALAAIDPEGAFRFEAMAAARDERLRGEKVRSALAGAYDVNTGTIDPVAARSAFASGGDISGAMAFDQQQGAARAAQLKQARDNLTIMARLIDDAVDEPSYQRSVASARALGMDVSNVPPSFDPAYVESLKRQAEALRGDVDRELMAVAPGSVVIDKGTGRPVFTNPDRPRYYPVPPGGRLELDPSYQGPTVGAPAGPSPSPNGKPVTDAGSVIRAIFPRANVNQVRRDPGSALGRANPDSWHVRSGGAVDIDPIPGMTFDQYVQGIKDAGYSVIEARDEVNNPSAHSTGPHWHVVIGEKGGQVETAQANGRTYYKVGGQWYDNPEGR